METTTTSRDAYLPDAAVTRESSRSAVSWGAIIGGAFVAAALSIILIAGGTGLGFSSMSPWEGAGASATTLGISAIVWLLVTQIISAGLGGYIAGRLRTKWVDTHSDEVYFRDTAHGFLVWAVGAVISLILLSSAVSSLVSGTAKVGASALGGAGAAATAAVGGAAAGSQGGSGSSNGYMVDTLFRSDKPDASGNKADARAEVGRILTNSLAKGDMSADDKTYVAKVVAQQTGVDQPTAEKRVNDMVTSAQTAATQAKEKAQQAADAARKAAAAFALWAFVSLLVGAFSASLMATVGGRARDRIR
jgi:hypothetical protein